MSVGRMRWLECFPTIKPAAPAVQSFESRDPLQINGNTAAPEFNLTPETYFLLLEAIKIVREQYFDNKKQTGITSQQQVATVCSTRPLKKRALEENVSAESKPSEDVKQEQMNYRSPTGINWGDEMAAEQQRLALLNEQQVFQQAIDWQPAAAPPYHVAVVAPLPVPNFVGYNQPVLSAQQYGGNNYTQSSQGSSGGSSGEADTGKLCTFCRSNREIAKVFTSHNLKGADGMVTCPILRKLKCEICGCPGGDKAHTRSYCPENNNKPGVPVVKILHSERLSNGRIPGRRNGY